MSSHSLRRSRLIAFENAAAGHDGMLSDAARVFCVKPCKQSELDFYHTLAAHPALGPFAPTFYGELSQGVRAGAGATGAALEQLALAGVAGVTPAPPTNGNGHAAGPAKIGGVPANGASEAPLAAGAAAPTTTTATTATTAAIVPTPIAPPTVAPAGKPWKPSHGAAIEAERHVVLANAEHGFARPNVLDVKLGSRLWADDAPAAKRARLDATAAATTSGALGLRISGAKTWGGAAAEAQSPATAGYVLHGKEYGRGLDVKTVKQGFREFFFVEGAGVRGAPARKIVRRFVRDLQALAEVLEGEECRIYSSSLLFVYEGDGEVLRRKFDVERAQLHQLERLQQQREPLPAAEAGAAAGGVERAAADSRGDSGSAPGAADEGGDAEEGEDEDEDEDALPQLQTLKLIDFAHAQWTPGQGPDRNLLQGVQGTIAILEEILERRAEDGSE